MSVTGPQSLTTFPARYFAGWNDKNLETVDEDGRASAVRAHYDAATLARQLGLV
jgi:hypothetical protein